MSGMKVRRLVVTHFINSLVYEKTFRNITVKTVKHRKKHRGYLARCPINWMKSIRGL